MGPVSTAAPHNYNIWMYRTVLRTTTLRFIRTIFQRAISCNTHDVRLSFVCFILTIEFDWLWLLRYFWLNKCFKYTLRAEFNEWACQRHLPKTDHYVFPTESKSCARLLILIIIHVELMYVCHTHIGTASSCSEYSNRERDRESE